jgi:hypothetical protein
MKALITPLGALYVATGVMTGLLAVFLLLYALFPALIGVVAVNGAANGEDGALQAAVMMFGTTAIVGVIAAVTAVLAVAYIVDGIGLVKRRPWARWLGLGLALPVMGACFPAGMLVGLLAIVTLVMPDVGEEFGAPPA